MDYPQLFRDHTNIGLNSNRYDIGNTKRNFLKEPNRNFLNNDSKFLNNQSNINEKPSDNLKSSKIPEVKHDTEIERDVSMMSITDDSSNVQYYLPNSEEFTNESVAKKFHEDVIVRRNMNRSMLSSQLKMYGEQIASISYDGETGDVLILEILDYMQELECQKLPLGKNFLQGTSITIQQRNEGVNFLYGIVQKLGIERYTVASGMAIADRYIKVVGKSFDPKMYVYLVISCWFISCKWDLVEYPAVDDICEESGIKDVSILRSFEIEVLNAIDFYLGAPTPIMFLRPMTILKQIEQVSHQMAKCLAEICLQNYELAGHPTHIAASASYCLAMKICKRGDTIDNAWLPIIQFVMGLDIEDIRPVIATLARVLCDTNFKKEMPCIYYSEYRDILKYLMRKRDDLKVLANM